MAVKLMPGQHSHRCALCKTTWAHGDEAFGNDRAHLCPKCGEPEHWVHQNFGEKPMRVTRRLIAKRKAAELLIELLESVRFFRD